MISQPAKGPFSNNKNIEIPDDVIDQVIKKMSSYDQEDTDNLRLINILISKVRDHHKSHKKCQ